MSHRRGERRRKAPVTRPVRAEPQGPAEVRSLASINGSPHGVSRQRPKATDADASAALPPRPERRGFTRSLMKNAIATLVVNEVINGQFLSINAPAFFQDEDFVNWLNNDQPKFTWHKGGKPGEWSDVIVLVDPSLSGEGSDSDMPEHIWECIVQKCREHISITQNLSTHIPVWLKNL